MTTPDVSQEAVEAQTELAEVAAVRDEWCEEYTKARDERDALSVLLSELEKAANQRPLHERLRLVALELVKIAEADSRVVDNAKLAAWAAQLYALSTHMALGGGE